MDHVSTAVGEQDSSAVLSFDPFAFPDESSQESLVVSKLVITNLKF